MAIVKFGSMVVGVRGTIGGVTFSANGTGPYAKAWARPGRFPSAPQSDALANLASIAATWRDLTTTQQNGWDTWASASAPIKTNSLGETYVLSGFQWFCSVNVNLENMGQAHRVDAPTLANPTAPTITSVTAQVTPPPNSAIAYPVNEFSGFYLHALIALVPSTGKRSFAQPQYRAYNDNAPGSANVSIETFLNDTFGNVPLNYRIFARTARMNTHGVISAYAEKQNPTNP